MSLPEIILQYIDQSTTPATVLFDFNDGINTGLLSTTDIPYPDFSTGGNRKRMRGIKTGGQDRTWITLPVGFRIFGSSLAAAGAVQDALMAQLEKKKNVLRYNPDPANLPDVFFDTYSAVDKVSFEDLLKLGSSKEHYLSIPADPFARLAEKVLFDSTTVIAEIDGESGQWAAAGTFTEVTTDFVWGTKSGKATVASNIDNWIARTGFTPVNLSSYLTNGWVTAWLKIMRDTGQPQPLIRIGSDASNSREYQLAMSDVGKTKRIVNPGDTYTPTENEYAYWASYADYVNNDLTVVTFLPYWGIAYFDLNAPTAVVGSPNMAAVAFFEVFMAKPAYGTTGSIQVDNVTVSNGPICAPRARAPFVPTIYGVDTIAPAGFLMKTKKSANVNRVYIGKKEAGANQSSAVVDNPILGISGWTDPASTGDEASCHQGQYKRYSVSSTGVKIHPGQFFVSLHEGRYKLFAKVRTYDGGTVTVRRIGADKNHPDWARSPVVKSITALGNVWQFLDLGPMSLPFFDFAGDSDPDLMYSYLGLEVTGSGAAANFDVDFIDPFSVDGDGRIIISPSELQYLNLDTRYPGKLGIFGSVDGSANSSFGLGHRSRGGLKTLDAGTNNLPIYARDTATPTLVPEIEIKKVSYVPRVPVGKG
ncbi:MAG: SRPBCC family protein [Thermoleophilia bacterium]